MEVTARFRHPSISLLCCRESTRTSFCLINSFLNYHGALVRPVVTMMLAKRETGSER